MSYQYLLQLPEHLESALRAGRIVVDSGVARDISSRVIVAHLEMVAPQVVGASNPHLLLISTALKLGGMAVKATSDTNNFNKIIGLSQEVRTLASLGVFNSYTGLAGTAVKTVIDTIKLNQIISITQEIRTLSTVNLAVSGATLGVAVVGFAVVLSKLNEINGKLDNINKQIKDLDLKISELVKNEIGKLTADVKRNIKNCITLIHQLEDLGWSEYLEIEISKVFDNIESLMETLLKKYLDRDEINVSLDLAQCLQSAYANLLKAYLTERYLQEKSLDYPALRLQTLSNFSDQLSSPELLDELYEEYLVDQEKRFSEAELDVILALYRYGCQNTSNNVNHHYEILNVTPREQFQSWQRLLKASERPVIWLEH